MSNGYDDIFAAMKAVADRLKSNLDSDRPSVPAEIVWAYQNDEVLKAVASRISTGDRLVAVDTLLPDLVMLLRRVYFSFATSSGFDVQSIGILVEIGDDNTVSRLIDPFVLTSERHSSLSRQANGAFPLVVSEPAFGTPPETEGTASRFEAFVVSQGLQNELGAGVVFLGLGGDGGGGAGDGGGVSTTWRNVDTLTLDKNGLSDHQTDQRRSLDPVVAALQRAFRIDPALLFPGKPDNA
jgi:hypothetical protein